MTKTTQQSVDRNLCPVCGYPDLLEPAVLPEGDPSFEICVCCGTEFGVDDHDKTYDDLRAAWIERGLVWWSKSAPPPEGWDGRKQLEAAGAS